MSQQVWRLLSGKISRPNPNSKGKMELHPSPYDFIPTAGELLANKWRMRLIREIPDAQKSAPAPNVVDKEPAQKSVAQEPTVEVGDPAPDMRKMSADTAIRFIDTTHSLVELDLYMEQELKMRPKARRTVLESIEARRVKLSSPGSTEDATLDIALSESQS